MSSQPWIATSIKNGAQLAASELESQGGVTVGTAKRHLSVQVLDNGGSSTKAAADARTAVREHAAMLLIDGVGASSVAQVTDPANLPVFICFDGGDGLIDPSKWPTLFRMAPADQPMARRLADYIANSHPSVGLLSDDSDYGQQGRAALHKAFGIDGVRIVSDGQLPARVADVTPQVLGAKQAGATRLIVWASAADVAAIVQAVHEVGWSVPIITGTTGEDPLVRQRLAQHPDWLHDVTFVSFRMTAEVGPAPFEAFRGRYEAKFGAEHVGVSQNGKAVIQPPDWAMFSYDAVRLVMSALASGGSAGTALMEKLNQVSIVGANGDYRGYGPAQHEGVNPSDMYFARFDGFTFVPVGDDPLSDTLPSVNQLS
ncbi:hypothetical protein GCM10023322_31860 [Rugosimonospora acidiphila]|uniref:Leucine-binding protein domain-containing protein n=1 Tax=Rugosimonospora acidiphila TaxID=556531 RepID=A0ABP9RUC8_9ACTN